jgi:hypothetical protein
MLGFHNSSLNDDGETDSWVGDFVLNLIRFLEASSHC